jgi:arylsulfatase A-like enzyme/Flp pilus assembly protein TadD
MSRGAWRTWFGAGIVALLAAGWWLQNADRSPWQPAAVPGGNLLLVTVDTLRADRLTSHLTPNLTKLAASGHVFRTAYTHAPLTLPSHASMLTGVLPPVHGVRGNGAFRLDAAKLTLAERLASNGYRTGAFVGAFVLDSRFGLDQGFDHYDGVADDRAFAADFAFAERRAPDVLNAAARWILDPPLSTRPWFAWVHVFDPHAPYDAPGAPAGAGYDGEVGFVDRAVGDFLERLDRGGALARTVVIVTADHGESLGEHGESTHGLFTYDATMRVPLFVAGPQLGSGRHEAAAGHIDLVPTVLDVLGLPPDTTLPGRSLRLAATGDADTRPIYLEAMDGWLTAGAAPAVAIVEDGWKLVATPIPELYDLAADPGETRNAIAGSPARARRLRADLPALAAGAGTAARVAVTPEVEARLRSLGYASGGARQAPAAFAESDDPKRVLPLYERFLGILAGGGRDLAGLQAIVEVRPSFDAARLAAAAILIETGRAAAAVAMLEPAAAAPGGSLSLRERLGAAHLAAGRPDRAAAVLDRVVAEGAASADAWNALGVARAQLGRHSESQLAFAEAVRLAPGAARIALNRAVARLQSGDRTAAATDVAELVRTHPQFGDGWKLLATLRHESGDRAGAVEAWQRTLALDAADFDVWFNVAVTLRDLGRVEQARAAARRFRDGAPRPAYDRELAMLASLLAPAR